MGVGDRAAVADWPVFRIAGIALGYGGLGYGVFDHLAAGVAIQPGPLHRVGVVPVIGYRELFGIRAGDVGTVGLEREHGLKISRRRPQAVLVAGVVPDLGHDNVVELVLVGIGDFIQCIGGLDRAGRCLITVECRVRSFTFGNLQFGTDKHETIRKISFGYGVSRSRRQVVDTDRVALFDIEDNGLVAYTNVPPVIATEFCAADNGALIPNRIDGRRILVPNRDPDPPVRVFVRIFFL